MNKTKIPWCDYTINPVKGLCPMACEYCYARRMYKRFKWNEAIRWHPPAWDLVDTLNKPSRIFVGSTFELFLDTLPENWMEYNLLTAKKYPQHTFIFLTKQPQNLIKWSPFPDNCFIGVTATDNDMAFMAVGFLRLIEAKVKFISFEPLLKPIIRWVGDAEYLFNHINWVIIGARTPFSVKTFPKWKWVAGIINACDKANIPVFLKNNLGLPRLSEIGATPYYKKHQSGTMELRQEFPE